MFEHFWAKLMRRAQKPEQISLRDRALRSLYLDEGRSRSNHPAGGSIWLRVVERIKRHGGGKSSAGSQRSFK